MYEQEEARISDLLHSELEEDNEVGREIRH